MKKRTKIIISMLACAAIILGTVAPGAARVFWRRRAATLAEAFDTAGRWSLLLNSDVKINGGRGKLEVLGCEDDILGITETARAANRAGALIELHCSERLASALFKTKTGFLHLIALGGAFQNRSVVFLLSQSSQEHASSAAAPAFHASDTAFSYPGSEPKTFIEIEETRAQLEISHASVSAEAVDRFFDSAFRDSGWARLTPPGGIALFQKGAEIYCVFVRNTEAGGGCTVALLRKRLDIK